jgi:hypothetical protein
MELFRAPEDMMCLSSFLLFLGKQLVEDREGGCAVGAAKKKIHRSLLSLC